MTVIGEAANQLPDSLRDDHPDVPWRQPTRLRNRIVHGYWGIDLEVVHTAALVELPDFVRHVREVRRAVEADEE